LTWPRIGYILNNILRTENDDIMAIKKVWIIDGCTSCGLCESLCPEVFEIRDIAEVRPGVDYSLYENEIKEAAEECPVEVIKFE
jgi:ferredoxin